MKVSGPIVLLILDGWGIAPASSGNAMRQGNTPHIERLWNSYPHTELQASGEAVGLPHGEVGNTEVGHLNLGAGHIVYQDLPRINMVIADGSFFANPEFIGALNHAKQHQSTLHIMGLIGAGGVHANNEHLFSLLALCYEQKFTSVALHLFTDGRDSPPTVALSYIHKVQEKLNQYKFGHIASIIGRYYAMDRDERWERTEIVYRALTAGDAPVFSSADEVIQQSYEKGVTDEFIKPSLIKDASGKTYTIGPNDAVIFYNFRIDRPRQLTKAFVFEDFEHEVQQSGGFDPFAIRYIKRHIPLFKSQKEPFRRGKQIPNLYFVTMTEYEKNLPVHVAFPPQVIKNPLGRVLAEQGKRQLRLAESEKERFVTFYFNGQREMPFIGEDRYIVKSLEVATYDLAPQMRAREITEVLIQKLQQNFYDCIVVNFANADMVGHTGKLPEAIAACAVIDECIGVIDGVIAQKNGALLITADHGNAEGMIDEKTGGVNTEHSGNPVPFIAATQAYEGKPIALRPGILADVAPTILSLMGMQSPIDMSGRNLLQEMEG